MRQPPGVFVSTAVVAMKRLRSFTLILLLAGCGPAAAYKLDLLSDADRKKVEDSGSFARQPGVVASLVSQHSRPVHEQITRVAYSCANDHTDCDVASGAVPSGVLAGVKWSDNPPAYPTRGRFPGCKKRLIRLETDSSGAVCWIGYLLDGAMASEKRQRTEFTESYMMLYRTHFGDMQFLHGMASAREEAPSTTLAHMLAWGEFAYRLSSGPDSERIGPRAALGSVAAIRPWFSEEKARWSAHDLFSLGEAASDEKIRDMAFGSLLHMVQDAFSASHVERQVVSDSWAGHIVGFNVYGAQRARCHGKADDAPAGDRLVSNAGGQSAVRASRALVRFRAQGGSWSDVSSFLTKEVLKLSASPRRASDGGYGTCAR